MSSIATLLGPKDEKEIVITIHGNSLDTSCDVRLIFCNNMFGGNETNNFDGRKNVYQKLIPDKIRAKIDITMDITTVLFRIFLWVF